MRNLPNLPSPVTSEESWAQILESNRFLTERQVETDRLMKENERILSEKFSETDRRMKELQKLVGSWSNNHGSFAEEYFFNAFETGKTSFFGENFNDIVKNVTNRWQELKDEYDIVLYNHTSVALIEVKYKAHISDVEKVLEKAETYRILFPNYKDFKIYLGLASLSFYPELEQKCINQGIAVIKQVGNTVVINDTNLKVF